MWWMTSVIQKKPIESAQEAAAIAMEMARTANLPTMFVAVTRVVREPPFWVVTLTNMMTGRRYVAKINATTGDVEAWEEEKPEEERSTGT